MERIVWSDIARAPKLTSIFRRTHQDIFHELAAELSQLVGYDFQAKWNGEAGQDTFYVSLNGQGRDGYVRLILQIYDLAHQHKAVSGYEIQGPTVRIVDLLVSEQGSGMGTAIVRHVLMRMEEIGFEKAVLEAGSRRAVQFWRKFGFRIDPVWSRSEHQPSMYLHFARANRTNRVRVRVYDAMNFLYEFEAEE